MTNAARPATIAEEHLRRFQATREPEALGALFEATAPALLRVALATAPDTTSAENALQETFLAVLAAPERWDETRPVMPWLLGILHRQIGTARRDRVRAPDPFRITPPLREEGPVAAASSREETERVRDAIEELPEPYRQVALLRWRHGLEPAEIAHLRNEPPGTTRSLLSRAIEKLRRRLGALAIAFVGDGRGLRAIRSEVVAHARRAAPAGTVSTATAILGGLAMKKAPMAIVALLLLVVAAWGLFAALGPTQSAVPVGDLADAATEVAPRPRLRATTTAELPAVIDPESEISGRVVGPDGAPIASAQIRADVQSWKRLYGGVQLEESPGPTAVSASDGSFRLPGARGVSTDLVVHAKGFPEQTHAGFRAGNQADLHLARGTPVVVEVVDAEGRAVVGAKVVLHLAGSTHSTYDGERQHAASTTDAAGTARFEAVVEGEPRVEVVLQGVSGSCNCKASLRVPQTEPCRVVLPSIVTIEGTVTDAASGAPLASAVVRPSGSRSVETTTDAKGRYAIEHWSGTSLLSMVASAPGFGADVGKLVAPSTVNFALRRSFAVHGRAIQDDGTAIGDARAVLIERIYDPIAVEAQPDGRFTVEGATLGATHTLVVAAPGRRRVVVELPSVPAGGANTFDAGDVVLPRGRRLAGILVDGEGRPCAGDRVTVWPKREGTPTPSEAAAMWSSEVCVTDGRGQFRFDDLAPGEWNVAVFAEDTPRIVPICVTLPPDRDVDDVRVVLAGGRTLRVRVVDDGGSAVAEADVQLRADFGWVGDGRYDLTGWTDTEGRCSFRGLPAGPVQPFASVKDGRPFVRGDDLPEITPAGQEVTIVLARAVAMRGRVVDDADRPLARFDLDVFVSGQSVAAGYGWTDDRGAFEIMVLPGQSVDVRMRGTFRQSEADGGKSNVASEFRGGIDGIRGPVDGLLLRASKEPQTLDRALDVLVLTPDGEPLADVEVNASWGGPRGVEARTDGKGRAHLDKLPGRELCVRFSTRRRRETLSALLVPPSPLRLVAQGQEVRVLFRAGVELHGRVVDRTGKPLSADVSVIAPDGAVTAASADAGGHFVVAALPGVPSNIWASVFVGGAERTRSAWRYGVVPGTEEIEFVLRAGKE